MLPFCSHALLGLSRVCSSFAFGVLMSIICITHAHMHDILTPWAYPVGAKKNGMAYLRVFNCLTCFYCLFKELAIRMTDHNRKPNKKYDSL